ncbi:MAG: hypothetical protein ABIQ39_15635 [Ilumatobacteraceae bacterium]
MERYTLVQHSGYGYAGKEGFAKAVETRRVSSDKVADAIVAAGGVVIDGYVAAEDAAENENYPPDLEGLYPRVNGRFGQRKVDGLALYIPKIKEDA